MLYYAVNLLFMMINMVFSITSLLCLIAGYLLMLYTAQQCPTRAPARFAIPNSDISLWTDSVCKSVTVEYVGLVCTIQLVRVKDCVSVGRSCRSRLWLSCIVELITKLRLETVCKSWCMTVYTPWVKKTRHPTLAYNFTKYWPIFKILSLLDSVGNL